jgi:lysophospholipase L1-like esterase
MWVTRDNTIRFALMVFIVAVLLTNLTATEEIDTTSFLFKNREHRITVLPTPTNPDITDLLLTTEGQEPLNISGLLLGKNVLPVATLSPTGESFTIAWLQYTFDNMQLCLYDSQTGTARKLDLNHFKSAIPIQVIYYNDLPYLLLFKGNNSNNTDIFYYHLDSGKVKNITQSPDCDRTWQIQDERHRLFIETSSLYHHYRFRIKKETLKIKQTKAVAIPHEKPERSSNNWNKSKANNSINTIVGYGDSITEGTIRMDPENPEDYEYPELAYLSQLEEMLETSYGEVYMENLGVGGNTTYDAVDRLDDAFDRIHAFFCIILLGTNDVIANGFDVDESIENLEYIIQHVKNDYGLYPIISTIPPQKNENKYPKGQQVHVLKTIVLNSRIKMLAEATAIPIIDAHHAFFNKDGQWWEELIEAYKGNHPSPTGHEVLANLFKTPILAVPPAMPHFIIELTKTDTNVLLLWAQNKEFDFKHYFIEWGYSEDDLNQTETIEVNSYWITPDMTLPQYDKKIFFRIQSVDQDDNVSSFSDIQTVQWN